MKNSDSDDSTDNPKGGKGTKADSETKTSQKKKPTFKVKQEVANKQRTINDP